MADTDEEIREGEEPKSKGDLDADKDLIEEAKKDFAEVEEAENENRERGEESIRFGRMGEQWPDDVRKMREDQKRPVLTVNQMPAFVRQVVNDARQNKPGIKVHPVDSSGDPKVAEIFDGLIRAIETNSDAEVAYDTAIDNAASGGIGFLRVDLEYTHEDAFDLDIKINRIANPFSVYGDPASIAADSSDWRRAFVIETLTKAEFKAKYPGATDTVDWEAKDDKDRGWKDKDGIRTAEYWRREEEEKPIALMSDGSILGFDYLDKPVDRPDGLGQVSVKDLLASQGLVIARDRKAKFYTVTQRIITGAEVLDTVPWPGKYIPIIPVYGEEVWADGKRHLYSLIHWGMDPQRIYNYGRSASIEIAALQPKAPYIGPVGAFQTDQAKWSTANSENHAFIEFDVEGVPGATPPQRQPPPQMSTAWLQETKVAADDMKSAIGMFNASLGQRSNEVSGVAIGARKLEGDVSTFHFIDNLSRGIRHTGRILVDLIPKVYDRPRMVRVLGEDRKTGQMVQVQGVQKPMMGHNGGPPLDGQPPAAAPGGPMPPPPVPPVAAAPAMPPPGQVPAMASPSPNMMPPDPQAQANAEAAQKVFDLSVGKYDVTVSAGPSFTTKREEAANQQMEMIKAFPQLGMLTGDIVARNLDWPGADEFAKRIVEARNAQAQGQGKEAPPAAVDPMAKAQADAAAKVESAKIGAAADVQVAQIQTEAKKQRDILEVNANKEVELAKIASEQELARQRTVATALTGQAQPVVHPGGSPAA